ncbi:IEC3 subunit of the Ino80 complex, chromatin re-modelling-domain-containing protein [Lineolata rhizophorae]|uniref:IEC3 subunit of the Ino80 complex, chromatin re-modelling-domain-containing protein n=1 Tax=Lineolata rhizophorae TaxID=578093 RepID=A0A6A6P3D7_9PEZI|nr:IEC3 subunit of the Ino80 complex, chromatin re-modelling-domain-containing protein [Lineolata rhizophorae]
MEASSRVAAAAAPDTAAASGGGGGGGGTGTGTGTGTGGDGNAKLPIKSWRKKYRKMRLRFDEKIGESNRLLKEEHKALALARRLQEQNDQLLDILLDLNETAHLPSRLRLDLAGSAPAPAGPASPALTSHDLPLTTPSLARLAASTPHTRAGDAAAAGGSAAAAAAHLPPELRLDAPPGYLSPAHEDEYLTALDAALTDPTVFDPSIALGRPLLASARHIPSDKELAARNPVSVYNWLRNYQPHVFLQDKDGSGGGAGGDALATPAAARGAAKRASVATASSAGARAAHDDGAAAADDDFAHEAQHHHPHPAPGTGRGRKRAAPQDDDGAYRPKGGRAGKRKREDGEGGGGGGGGGRGGRKRARGAAAGA